MEMAQATEEFETLSAAFTAQRVLAREIWARAEEAKARIGDHLAEAFQQELNTGRNAQEVAAELEDVRGQLELIANVAPNTIERYEELRGVVRLSLLRSLLFTRLSVGLSGGWSQLMRRVSPSAVRWTH